jgi:hypothetical protein
MRREKVVRFIGIDVGQRAYEAACDALATVTPSIDPTAGS